jgi:hypothetical protein
LVIESARGIMSRTEPKLFLPENTETPSVDDVKFNHNLLIKPLVK